LPHQASEHLYLLLFGLGVFLSRNRYAIKSDDETEIKMRVDHEEYLN